MKSSVKIELSEGQSYVNISGKSFEVMRLMVFMFEQQPATREFFEDAIKHHDDFKKYQEETARNAKEN